MTDQPTKGRSGRAARRRVRVGNAAITAAGTAALVVGSALSANAGDQAKAHRYEVAFTGDSGVSFAGECTLETASGSQTVSLEGDVPHTRELSGAGIKCKFVNSSGGGKLVVELRKNGNLHFRSSTNKPEGVVSFAMR